MTLRWRIWVPREKHAPVESVVLQYAQSLFSAEVLLVQTDVDNGFVLSVQETSAPKALLVKCQSRLCRESPDEMAMARQTADNMGGAGMDVLVARGMCIWSWDATDFSKDPARSEAETMIAGVLAMSELGCVLLPDQSRLVGLRGVREWLETKSRRG